MLQFVKFPFLQHGLQPLFVNQSVGNIIATSLIINYSMMSEYL